MMTYLIHKKYLYNSSVFDYIYKILILIFIKMNLLNFQYITDTNQFEENEEIIVKHVELSLEVSTIS